MRDLNHEKLSSSMPSPTVSIIIPVYNIEKYLPRCLDSILRQDFKDFELILVDDGSKDSSGAMCEEYAGRDSRIRVIHQANGGISSGRNAGIDVAKGKYITFMDGDDWVADDCLSSLLFSMTEGVDLVVSKSQKCLESETTIYPKSSEVSVLAISTLNASAFAERLAHYWFDYIHSKLFRADIIRENSLRFLKMKFSDGSVFFMEDTFFVMDYLAYCRNGIAFNDRVVYAYVKFRNGALTMIPRGYFNDSMTVCNKMIESMSRLGVLNEDMENAIRQRRLKAASRETRRVMRQLRMPFSQKRRLLLNVIENERISEDISACSFDLFSKEDARRLVLLREKSINRIIIAGIWERLASAMKRRLCLSMGR